ncbi:hypothetical protein C8R43DRAFT_1116316 [Mycena crocata]|nr:hypothetical protein C8R43DRAFT_1116316 [Mycena crocata]
MPKASISPEKSRLNKRSNKSPPKSSKFVDDQADESDGDGVMVDQSSQCDPGTDIEKSDALSEGAEGDKGSDYEFINDGDPYEGYVTDGVLSAADSPPPSPSKSARKNLKQPLFMTSPSLSPPTTPAKLRGGRALDLDAPFTPSPSKRKASSPAIIELSSSSEEDLEAMAGIQEAFQRQISGIASFSANQKRCQAKSASSQDGRVQEHVSAASNKKFKVSSTPAISRSASPSETAGTVPKADSVSGNPFVDPSKTNNNAAASDDGDAEATFKRFARDPNTAKLLNSFMAAFMREHGGDQTSTQPPASAGSRSGRRTAPVASGSRTASRGKSSKHVDHDDLALQEGILSSLSGSAKKPIKQQPRSLSPDWTPPDVSELIAQSSKKGASSQRKPAVIESDAEDSPSLKRVKKSKDEVHFTSVARSKGKEKASVRKEASDDQQRARNSVHGGASLPSKDGKIADFVDKKNFPVSTVSGGTVDGEQPLTMAQYMRMARGEEPSPDDARADDPVGDDDDEPPAYLEDLEAYRAYYDPKSKCGVFDVKLQDPSLRPHYIGLPPLPALRIILPSYDPNRNSTDDIDFATGGRVRFSSWANVLPRMLAANSMGAMLFTESGHFINPSRVSPAKLSSVISPGSSQTHRLHVNDRVAVCVSAVCVTESCVFAPKNIGTKSDRQRKWLYGVLHDYDWERLCSLTCLVFSERVMYAQINNQAISFQTMISPDGGRQAEGSGEKLGRNIPSQLFSSQSPGKTMKNKSAGTFRSKTLLAHNDTVPVYDARKIVVDFNKDLGRLDEVLPLFPGEVPQSSFAVVGYSMSCYNGTVSGSSGKVANLGCNIIWVIVCGTPPPPSRA